MFTCAQGRPAPVTIARLERLNRYGPGGRAASVSTAEQRFEKAVAPHFDVLYRTALRLTRRPADAEDLVQDVCLRAFAKLADLETADRPLAWLQQVQYRLFLDAARRRRRSPVRPLPDGAEPDTWIASEEPGPEESVAALEGWGRLERAWRRLDAKQRALLALHAEGYGLAEIARIAGISSNAVSARLHRARARLGRLLRESDGRCPALAESEGGA